MVVFVDGWVCYEFGGFIVFVGGEEYCCECFIIVLGVWVTDLLGSFVFVLEVR